MLVTERGMGMIRKRIAVLLCMICLTVSAAAVTGELPYTDVEPTAWYAACVEDVTDLGLLNGVGDARFDPEGTLDRAMLVTVLWRMNGCPAPAAADVFTDVEPGTWYTDAVNWAAEKKVVEGIGDGLFAPKSPVTREQMAAIFYRWAKGEGLDVSVEETELARQQGASDWAVDAVNWAIPRHLLTRIFLTGLPHGGSGYFYNVPSFATRAEAAVFLSRFWAEYLTDPHGRTPVHLEAAGLETGNCDLLITGAGEERLAIYTISDARIGTHFYAEPAAPDARRTEARPVYGDLPRTYDEEGRLVSIDRDGIPVYAVDYDEQGRVTDLTIEEIVHYHIFYSPWGDPLFVEIENTASGVSTVFALYCEERDGAAVLTLWGEDAVALERFMTAADAELTFLEGLSAYTPEDWASLSDVQLNDLYERLTQTAMGHGQKQRDIYLLRAALHSDGAYTELLSGILCMQYEADPGAWTEAITAFSEEDASLLQQLITAD